MRLIQKLQRVNRTIHLFDEDKIVSNFMGMYKFFDAKEIKAPDSPHPFPRGKAIELPGDFSYEGTRYKTGPFLEASINTGLVVIKDGKLVFEQYRLGNSESTPYISWSMAKSFVSALFGIAVEEAYIRDINQTVDEYLPRLKGSGYEGVRIKDVLQMSAGIQFDEDYGRFRSDINRWGRRFAWGSSQDKFAGTLVREEVPGKILHYVSINTHVLGMIIVKATGKSLSTYLEEKLWKPMGMEYNAYWLCDNLGMEVALGGLNMALRDYAKIGQLYMNHGTWQDRQLVPEAWAIASVTPDAPHLRPENNKLFGYGYQWWVPQGNEGEFLAMGIYNQFIYVNPATRTVIAHSAANYRFNEKENPYSDPKVFLELFRAIAHGITP